MANLKNLLVLGSARFLNTIKGTIEKAEKLATSRTIQTKLDSTSSASFDGSANVTPGVSGILPVTNGGTGADDAAEARTNLGLGNAATQGVETTVADDSKLPTGAAVKAFVEGKGYDTIGGSMEPIDTHTWTNVYTTANNDAAGFLYFAKVHPTAYVDNWEIYYRIHATIAGVSDANGNGKATSYVYINGMRNSYTSYSTWNNIDNTNYRPYHNHVFYRAKQAGIDTNKKGHALGVRLYSSWNPNVAANARTIKVDILYTSNCSVTWIDPMDIWADVDGTGSTNYAARSEFDGQTQGSSHTGDRNDTGIYVYGPTTHFKAGSGGIKAYSLILQDGNGTWQSVHATNGTTAANKVKNSAGFRLGQIYYVSTGSNFASGAAVGDNVIRYFHAYVDARYSFNIDTNDLVGNEEIYLVGELHSDGLFYLDSPWWTQTEPTSDDGKIYIPVGYSRLNYANTYQMDFRGWQGAYWYKNGQFQEVVLSAVTVNGHTVASDVPSNLSTVMTKLGGTAGSPNKAIYLNEGNPTPVDHSIGHDEDENVVVAWDGGQAITPPAGTALPIAQGGTGATTAAEARTNLGLGSAATYNVVASITDDSNLVTGGAIKAYYEAVGIPSAICTTVAGTAAKVATCSSFKLLANSYIQVIIANANTASSALTLNINSTGAKPIIINGSGSSSTNCTLPAGSYFVFYNGTNYYFRTDGKITGDITGDAATVNGHSVAKDVPSNAVFTDTTALGSMTGTLGVSHGGTGQTSLQAARNAMGLGNTTGALPVANGGTGATSAADALSNLGIVTKDYTFNPSISAGTIGTRGAQVTVENEYYSTHNLVSLIPISIENSAAYIVSLFAYGSNIYCNYYRCVSTATTATNVTVRATFIKK